MKIENFNHSDIYKLIFESSTEGIVVCNKQGEIQMLNDSVVQLFGYEREELLGEKIEIFLPKKEKENHTKYRTNYTTSPKPKKMGNGRDLYGMTKTGDSIPLEISLNHLTIENELFVVALITNISERKLAENQIHTMNNELEKKVEERTQELKEKQILNNLITKNFPNGIICVLDKDLIFAYAAGEELSKNGIDGKFLIGKNYLDSINKENNTEAILKLSKVFKGEMVSFEVNKNEHVFQVDAVPLIYDETKGTSQVLIVEHNITNVKRVERSMQESLLKEKELNELKTNFVTMASHEFRTPLSTMLSSLALLEKYIELGNVEKRNGHILKIRRNIKNLTSILDDTLTISKIEEGKDVEKIEEINIVDLFKELNIEMEGLKKDGQKINVYFKGSEIIKLDVKIAKIVLANILSNALKYSREDVRVEVITSKKELNVHVIDKGIGIPLKEKSKLFERFYRANNAAHIQGTGLGLNIVNGYISKLKGTIEIESEENIGTKVFIKIPIM